MSGANPLPKVGDVFFDARGEERALRLSWHPDSQVMVVSIWNRGVCSGTFRLPAGDIPAFVEALSQGVPPVEPRGRRHAQADYQPDYQAEYADQQGPGPTTQALDALKSLGQPANNFPMTGEYHRPPHPPLPPSAQGPHQTQQPHTPDPQYGAGPNAPYAPGPQYGAGSQSPEDTQYFPAPPPTQETQYPRGPQPQYPPEPQYPSEPEYSPEPQSQYPPEPHYSPEPQYPPEPQHSLGSQFPPGSQQPQQPPAREQDPEEHYPPGTHWPDTQDPRYRGS